MSDNNIHIFVPDNQGDYFYQIVVKTDMTEIQFVVRQYDKENGLMIQSAPGPKFQRYKHD